jgi:putative ABC transport system permease protein
MPIVFDLTPNWHFLGFTSAVAIRDRYFVRSYTRVSDYPSAEPSAVFKEDARSRSRTWLLSSRVQVALSLLLLIGAGLFVRTLQNLHVFYVVMAMRVKKEGRLRSKKSQSVNK